MVSPGLDGVRMYEEPAIPWLEDAEGSRGLVVLVDRANERTLAISFWTEEEAERQSGEARRRFEELVAERVGLTRDEGATVRGRSRARRPPRRTAAVRRRFASGLAAVAVAAAGCGGGGGGERLSRQEFVARADGICRKYEARLDALGQPTNVEELRSFADKAIPIARDGREELGEVEPPVELEDTYDAWLEHGDRAIELVERIRDAAEDRDQAQLQRIAREAEETDRESNRLAAELGFRQCGEGAANPTP